MKRRDYEAAAKAGHDEYERIAPEYGYKTRAASAVPWDDLTPVMKEMMIRAFKAGVDAALRGTDDR